MHSPEKENRGPNTLPTVSRVLENSAILELVYDHDAKRTQFAVGKGNEIRLVDNYELPDGIRLVPYSATNNLIRHEVLLLAQKPEPYGSVDELAARIDAYLQRYVGLSEDFRTLLVYYVLLTWVYDAFNELPYLRFRGAFGSGKTRALFVAGSLCNKAFFASGASTVSPIFHTLDTFRGTLLFDEADFRYSDEKAELVKILNNGNVRGFPVLRTAVTPKKEFEPRAFMVFGPKLVAMRHSFEDEALESRFFTEAMGQAPLDSDIPINLPEVQRDEALELRNQLLAYRFATLTDLSARPALVDPTLSPRLNQILVPLLSIIDNQDVQTRVRACVLSHQSMGTKPKDTVEQHALTVLAVLFGEPNPSPVSVGLLTSHLIEKCGAGYRRPLTSRYVGEILRERLGILTYKSHGVFVIPTTERPKVQELCTRFAIPFPISK